MPSFSGIVGTISSLLEQTSVADSDYFMVGGADAKKIKFLNIANAIKNKMAAWTFSLNTTNKTLPGAINELSTNLGNLATRLILQKYNVSVPVNAWTTFGTITAPEAGTYLIVAAFEFPMVEKGNYYARVIGSSFQQKTAMAPVYGQIGVQSISTVATLPKGEVLSFQAYNNTAGTHGVRACIIRL